MQQNQEILFFGRCKMSDQPTPCDTPPGEQQEPTVVTMAVVGSNARANAQSSWNEEAAVTVHGNSSDLCGVSSLDSDSNAQAECAVTLTSTSSVSSAISHMSTIIQDGSGSTNFMHSGMVQDADSTSGSLGVCDDEHMLVDGSLHSGTGGQSMMSQESMSVSQDSDNSDDHMSVMDNVTAQEFLRQPDLLNAATSVLHSEKSSAVSDDILGKSDISHNLISSLDHHHHQSNSHHSESMAMQNLLHDQSDLEGSVPAITAYLEQSQAQGLADETSQIHMEVNPTSDMQTDNMCFPPSPSGEDDESVGMSSDTCISTGVGLPPVSTIIRSSVAKGRFDAFCRPSSMIMGIPQFLNSSGSFDAMPSMSAIQRISSEHCGVLPAVSLTSPLEVPSSRQNVCTDLNMETVEVPLSSSLVCSTSSSDLSASVVESRCIKPTSSVMTSLGPDLDKQSVLTDARIHADDNLNSLLNSKSCIPEFPGVIPIREIISIGSPTQVQNILSAMRMEDIQKVAAIKEHLRSETVGGASLDSSDDSLAHSIISPQFNCRDDLQHSGAFADDISQTPQSLPMLSVSAIETNVIMSTSNVDSAPKLTSSEMKVIETTKRLREQQQQLEEFQAISREVQNSVINQELLDKQNDSSRNSNIIFSTVQGSLNCSTGNTSPIFSCPPPATLSNQNLVSRSSIIERHIVHSSQSLKGEKNSGTAKAKADSSDSVLFKGKDDDIESLKVLRKLEEDNERHNISTVSPAVTASVIQQLLKSQASLDLKPAIQQRVTGGVITSVTSVKAELSSNIIPRDSDLTLSASVKSEESKIKHEVGDFRNMASSLTEPQQRTLLVNITDHEKLQDIAVQLNEDSLGSDREKTDGPFQIGSDKRTALPSLSASSLPAFFSNLPANAIASLQSSLKSPHSIVLPTSLPNITIAGSGNSVSLLSSFSSDLLSPPLTAATLLLPNILSSTLRGTTPVAKVSVGESSVNCLSSSSSSIYSGLLKSVGLPAVVKQEPESEGGSSPLPPFALVSGLPSMVKRELNATLASTFLNASGSTSSQIPVVTIKQEPGSKQSSVSASSILNASCNLPSVTSVQMPTELSVVVACSNTAATASSITSPVPSQASTIAFAGNNNTLGTVVSAAVTTTASGLSTSNSKEDQSSEKKWNCTMCKNGSPCGLHPTQSQGLPTSSSQITSAPPPLMSGDPAKPFQCTLCGKHLASKNVYQLHLRSHSGEKPFTCNLCGHHFSQKTSLTRHMRSHTGERPFPCEACGKRFADKERIKIHMRTHTGEKPFACEVCGKRFSQKSTVKRHMSVHTGEKPFKCETCGKGFANRGNLNAHSKTHANT